MNCLRFSAALSLSAVRNFEARGIIYRKRAIRGRVIYGFTQTPFQASYWDTMFRKVIHPSQHVLRPFFLLKDSLAYISGVIACKQKYRYLAEFSEFATRRSGE